MNRQNLKYVAAIFGAMGVLGALGAFPLAANAQYYRYPYYRYAYMPSYRYMYTPYSGYTYAPYYAYNPLAQWIILGSLFAPRYLFGYGGLFY